MPTLVYLNIEQIAKLLVSDPHLFSKDYPISRSTRAFFDEELKNIKVGGYVKYSDILEDKHCSAAKRVIEEMEYAKANPESVKGKQFLRDLYQVVYYLFGDEKSGLKTEKLKDTIVDKMNLIRIGNVKSLSEKLQLALKSESIGFSQFRSIASEYANALNTEYAHARDDKLISLVEKKLLQTAKAAIKQVDLGPDNMDRQQDDLSVIATLVRDIIDRLYPDGDAHKQELLKEWDDTAVRDRVFNEKKQATKKQSTHKKGPAAEAQAEIQESQAEIKQLKAQLFELASAALKVKGLGLNIKKLRVLAKKAEASQVKE